MYLELFLFVLCFSYVEMNVGSMDAKLLPKLVDDFNLDDIDSTLEWLKPKQPIYQPWRPWMNETESESNQTVADGIFNDEIKENLELEDDTKDEEDAKPRVPLVIRIRKRDRKRAYDENRNPKKVDEHEGENTNVETESQNNKTVDQNDNSLQNSAGDDLEDIKDNTVQDGIKKRLRPKSCQRNIAGEEMVEFDHSSSESAELNDSSSGSEESELDLKRSKKRIKVPSRKRKNSSSNSKVKSLSEPSVKSKILKVLGAIDINKPGFECRLCSKTFAKPALLKSHQRYIHAKTSKVKKYHPNLFNITDKTLKDTEKYHSAPKGHFKCPHCSDAFEVERSLEVHIGRKHNAKSNIPCPENCGKFLTCKSAIAKHLLSHRPREQWPYKCEFCKMKFQAKSDLPKHWNTSKHLGDPRIPLPNTPEYTKVLTRSEILHNLKKRKKKRN